MPDPAVLAAILGMALASYATRAGGAWLLTRLSLPAPVERAFAFLPGAVIVSIVAPSLAKAGPREWLAAALVAAVALRTRSLPLALLCGVVGIYALRRL